MQSTPSQPSSPPAPSLEDQVRAGTAARNLVQRSLAAVPLGGAALRPIDLLVIHCSATRSGVRLPRPADIEIDAWHQARGFRRWDAGMVARLNPHLPSIGYHFVIDLDGRMATGRSLAEPGAHVAGFNARSVGICMVGGGEPVARYTAAQWLALQHLVGRLGAELRIGLQPVKPGAPAGVCGHRDLSPDTNRDGQVTRQEWLKTCPGFDVAAWLQAGMQPLAENVLP